MEKPNTYIPYRGAWMDSPKICLMELFPGKSPEESDKIMEKAAALMENFLVQHGQESLGVLWMNRPDRDENPDFTIGFFRVYPRI